MDPDSWSQERDVCGSCIAWKPGDPEEGEDVAAGNCRLRPELRRVPATMAKCNIYKPRGKFTYQPARGSPRRRKNKVLSIVRVAEDGTEVRTERPAAPRRPEHVERPLRPPPPSTIDLDGEQSLPAVKQALIDMVRLELGRSRRELHSKFMRGGTAEVRLAGGDSRTLPATRLFSLLDRLQSSFVGLEQALAEHSDKMGRAEADSLIGQVKRMQGSFTTFNVMFEHREDWFTSK